MPYLVTRANQEGRSDRIQARMLCGAFEYVCPVTRELRPLFRVR